MAELESLVFSVDTTQLDGAQKKVDALATSVAGLEQATTGLSNAEANAIRTAAEITKAKAELTRANNALAKAEESAAKATEASTKALESNSKPIEQSTEKTSKLDKLLQNLANTHKDLTEGFSRSESSTLNMARSFGASADYIEKIQNQLKDIGKLTKNPFDASLGAIRSITNELEAMSNRAKLADKALFMTSKQLAEYSRITTEAEGKVIAAGFDPKSVEGLAKVNEIADKSRAIYEEKAKALNSLVAAEERSNNEARKTLELQANLNRSNNEAVDTLQRLSKITEMVNSGMSKQEAEYRLANASKGISKELTDNLIAAEKSLNTAIENQVKAKKAEEQQYKNSNSMMDAATQQYYKEKAAIEARNSAIRAGSAAMSDYIANLQQRTQRDTIAEKYVGQGASRATANLAAKSEMQGVPQSDIDSFVKQAAAMDIAVKKKTELANASKTLIDIEQRLAAALSQSNDGLNQQATDTLVKYQNALKATGASAEVTATKMAALKNQLDQVAAKERAQQLQHLARAISVQMGDIGVSLASGQNPLIVMIQQGDQIRGALEQAGAKGKELQVAMNNAAGTIATGFKNTALAVGGFAVGAMTKLKDSFVNVIPAALEYNKTLQIIRSSESTFADKRNFITARKELYATLPALATTAAVAILAVASAISQTIDAEKELTRTLILNGASLGVTNKELFAYAEGMKIAGASSNTVKLAMSEIITSGVQLKDSLLGITQVAIDLERYLGVAISATAKQYADLAKDPVKALAEFATSTGLINVETLQLVDSLVEMGDKTKAVTVATEALKNAQVEMVNAAKAEMTPLAVLWDNIKIAIQGVWQSTIDLGTSTPVITSLQTVWALLYSAISGVITAIKTAGAAIIGLSSISGKLLSFDLQGAKQELTDFNTVLAGIGGDYIKGIQGAMGFKDAVTTSSAKVLKANSDNAASFEAIRKTMKRVEDQSDKLDKKTATKPEYIKKYLEDQLKYAQAQMKTGQEVKFTTEQLKKQEEVAGRLWEKEQKKKRAPREKLNRPSNVDLQENKKSYESAIRLAEEFGKNERAILKNNYEAGLVERGAYIARDLALIIAGEQQRRQAIEAETAGLTQDYEKKRTALEAEAKRIKSSTLKGAPEQYQKVERALSDLSKQQETFNVLQGDKTAKLENEINLRYSETLKESNLVMVALNKSYTDFVKKQDDLATQRKDQIAFANTLMQLTGAEAAAYKAGAESVKQMTDELSKFKNDAKEADKVFSDFIANTKPSDFDNEAFLQRYMLLLKQKQNAATKVDEAIAKSGEYVEKAKTDAVTMYYQEEVKRISEGLSGVLTTAIFDGGEAGAKALRSFIEQELRKKFMIEIQANLVTPLVSGMFEGFSPASVTQGATSSIGGSLANTAIGSLGAVSGAVSGFTTAMTASAQSLVGITGTTAQMVTSLAQAGHAAAPGLSAGVQAFNAIPGWGWALAGAALLAGSGVFNGGETRSGGRYTTTNEGVKFNEGPSGGAINRYTEEQLNKQAFTSINNFLKNIGSKDFLTQFVSGIETSDNGKGGAFAGGTLSSGAKFGDTQSAAAYQFNENLSADDAMKRYTEEMNKVTIAALQAATDIPEYIAKAIADLDVEKLTAEQADAVVKDVQEMFTALKTANKYMRDFGATLFEATEKGALSLSLLTSEFGGLEQFNSAMQTFSSLVSSPFQQALSNYTELRTAIDELGIELPYSAEGIRQLTNGLDLNTEAGRKAYASTIQAGSAMIQAGDTLLQTIGTSTEELAGIIVEGMRNGDPAGAGQYFADTVVYGIENALYQNMGSQITQIITNGIITPLMQSMIAGSTAADAIAKLSITGIASQVQQVTNFFKDLFTNPEFIKIMDAMKTGLASVVTGFASDIPAPSFKEPVNPWKESDKAAKDAEDAAKKAEEAAKKAAEEWAKLLETLNDRKLTAEIKNIYLTQGNTAGLAAERAKELTELTKGLTTEQTNQITSIYKSITALEDLNKGIEDLTSSFSSAIGSLASAAQKESMGYVEAIKTLSKYGITADKQSLLQYSNAQLLEFVSSISQIGGISAESRAEVIKTVSAIGELNTTFRNQAEQDDALMISLLDAQGQNYEAGRKAVQVLAKMGTTIPKTTTELRYLLAKMSAAELQSLKFTDSLDGLVPAMKQLEKSVYSVFGLTEETITGVLQGILTGETKGIAAGQALGDAVYNGIKSVIATTGSQAVAQVFMQYILNPIVEAMLAGSTLSEAMNSVDVANGTKTAKDVASVYKEILGSTDIQQFAQIFFDAGNSLAKTSDKSSSSFTDLESTLLGSDKAARATTGKIDSLTSSITALGNAAKSAVPQAPVQAPIPQETLPTEVVKTISAVVADAGATVTPQGDPALIVEQLKAYFATAPSPLEIYNGIKATGVSYDLIAQALGTTTETVAGAVKTFAETVVSTRSTNTNLEYLNAAGEVVKSVLKEQSSPSNTTTPVSGVVSTYQPSGGYIPNRDLAGEEQKRNEGLQLQADLLRLQNKEQEALVIEYQLATVSMQPLVRELYDYNLELQKQITVLTQRKELESELLNLLGNTTELRKREMLTIDESNRSLKQLIWNLEDTKSATDKALENLKTLSDKLITELEKTFETTDNAYSALERALEAQKVAAEKQVEQSTTVRDNLKNIFEFLKDQVRELRGEVEQTKLMQAAEGRNVIRSAIGTGVVPEQKALEEAVAAARRGVEDQVYATKFERDRSYLLLANELDSLKTVVEPQLTDAEKALEVANLQLANSDELLKKYKDQIDVMRGVDISVLTVDQSIAKLETAIQAEALARDQITEIKLQVELAQKQYDSLRGLELGVTTMTQAIVNMQNAIVAELQATSAAKKLVGGPVVNQDLGTTWIDKVQGMSYTLPSGTPDTSTQSNVHSSIVAGWSASQFAEAASGIASGTLAEAGTPVYEAIVNDPRWTGAYADGGYNPGGIALVGEEGPELVNFNQPGQIFTAGQTRQALGTDNSELVDEIRNLREENKAQAGAIVRLQSQMLKLISRWDGNGLPETRSVV